MNWNKIHIKLLLQIHVSFLFLSVKYQSMLKIRGKCRIGAEVEHSEEFLGNYKHNDKKRELHYLSRVSFTAEYILHRFSISLKHREKVERMRQ